MRWLLDASFFAHSPPLAEELQRPDDSFEPDNSESAIQENGVPLHRGLEVRSGIGGRRTLKAPRQLPLAYGFGLESMGPIFPLPLVPV